MNAGPRVLVCVSCINLSMLYCFCKYIHIYDFSFIIHCVYCALDSISFMAASYSSSYCYYSFFCFFAFYFILLLLLFLLLFWYSFLFKPVQGQTFLTSIILYYLHVYLFYFNSKNILLIIRCSLFYFASSCANHFSLLAIFLQYSTEHYFIFSIICCCWLVLRYVVQCVNSL